MCKDLLILGNGFDLHCKLGTTYDKFFKYIKYNNNDNKLSNYLNSCETNLDRWSQLLNHNRGVNKNWVHSDSVSFSKNEGYTDIFKNTLIYNERTPSMYPYISNVNFWYAYFRLLERINFVDPDTLSLTINNKFVLNDWSDIEYQMNFMLSKYYQWLNSYISNVKLITKVIHKTFISQKQKITDVKNIIIKFHQKFVDNYSLNDSLNVFMPVLIMDLLENVGYNPNNQNMYKFLFNELIKFEDMFASFLIHRESLNYNRVNYKHYKNRTTLLLTDNKPYELITFNYTNNRAKGCKSSNNVHGIVTNDKKSQGHPIFGIDASNNYDKPYFRFTKTYRIMSLTNDNDFRFSNKIRNIIFYGQSLSKADYSYFIAIFDHYKIYDNSIELIFYYNSDVSSIEEQHQFTRIYKLMNYYGEVTGHKDILHKMLLEKRIQIKDLYKKEEASDNKNK